MFIKIHKKLDIFRFTYIRIPPPFKPPTVPLYSTLRS